MKKIALITAGIAVTAAGAGAAAAALGADGTVTACSPTRGGSVRFVDAESGQTCTNRETTLRLAAVDAAGKVADADKLDGLDAGAFVSVAHSETVVRNYSSRETPLERGSCERDSIIAPDSVPLGSRVLVTTDAPVAHPGLVFSGGTVELLGEDPLRLASWTICNVGGIGSSPMKITLTILNG